MPEGRPMANYWQGPFPYENCLVDGWEFTSPAGSYPANGYGLYDMIGNVWEWTTDWFRAARESAPAEGHTVATRRERRLARLLGTGATPTSLTSKVLKGGSHLCDVNHCHRYRPSARWSAGIRTSTSDIGFRCILRP
jgi:sulfatase modifying factor 1